jgi:hypothetical protein
MLLSPLRSLRHAIVSLLEPGMPLLCYAHRPISQTAYYSDREEGERHVAE